MSDTADQILSYLEGKSPDEIRSILAGLERAARLADIERAEAAKDRQTDFMSMDLEDLRSIVQREMERDIHSQNFRQASAALKERIRQEEQANRVPPPKFEPPPKKKPPMPDMHKPWWQLTPREQVTRSMYEQGVYTEELKDKQNGETKNDS